MRREVRKEILNLVVMFSALGLSVYIITAARHKWGAVLIVLVAYVLGALAQLYAWSVGFDDPRGRKR